MPLFKKSSSSKIPEAPPVTSQWQREQQPPPHALYEPGQDQHYGAGQNNAAGYGSYGRPAQNSSGYAPPQPQSYQQQGQQQQGQGQGPGQPFQTLYQQQLAARGVQPREAHPYQPSNSGQGQGQGQAGRSRYAPSVTESTLDQEYGGTGGGNGRGGGGGGYGAQLEQTQEVDSEEEEIEAIKQQMRYAKQDSLQSTREAIRMAREAEETATNSITRLGDQSEKLGNTEHNFDLAKQASTRADDNTRDIVKLNRSIFIPAITTDKKGKRLAEEARLTNRHIEEREQRERLREEAARARARVEETVQENQKASSRFARDRFGLDRFGGGGGGGGSKQPANDPNSPAARMAQRARYQFEASTSDDELEDELDANMDEISAITGRLNKMGRAMGQEIDDQNTRIKRMTDKAAHVDTKIYSSTQKLANIK